MMELKKTDLVKALDNVKYNPMAMQQVIFDTNIAADGEDILNASCPFAYLVDVIAASTASANHHTDAATRKMYAALANSEEELNNWVDDTKQLGRFALPAKTNIKFYTSLTDVRRFAVHNPATGTKDIIIPAETVYKVSSYYLAGYYPIIIRILENDTVSVMYDTSEFNPYQKLTTNTLEHCVRTMNAPGYPEMLEITIPVEQTKRTQYINVATGGGAFYKQYTFTDSFYYARVFTGTEGAWDELHVTFSKEVYDSIRDKPTAILAVNGDTLTVEIPQIYYSRGDIAGSIKVEIYNTQGELSVDLSKINTGEWTLDWSTDKKKILNYSHVLNSLSMAQVYSIDYLQGGKSKSSFQSQRNRIINNPISGSTPVTPEQLRIMLQDLNYDMVTYNDYINANTILASKNLPTVSLDKNTSVSVTCAALPFSATMDNLVKISTVINNGKSITIRPETLFILEAGLVRVLGDSEVSVLMSKTGNTLTSELNDNQYLYTPYYWVYSVTNNFFDYHGFELDTPETKSHYFVTNNTSTTEQINTKAINLVKVKDGYELLLSAKASKTLMGLPDSGIVPQLAVSGHGQGELGYLNGKRIGNDADGDPLFKFQINTTHNIKTELTFDGKSYTNHIELTGIKVNPRDVTSKFIDLDCGLYITYTVNGVAGILPSACDKYMGEFLLKDNSKGLTTEKFDICFGRPLDGLFNASMSVMDKYTPKVYTSDVFAHYPEDVYRLLPSGIFDLVPNPSFNAGKPVSASNKPKKKVLLHAKGSAVLDSNNKPVILHAKGSVVIENGKPVVANAGGVLRVANLTFLDGKLRFVTELNSMNYVKSIPVMIQQDLVNDILPINDNILAPCVLQFYPKRNIGEVDVYVSEDNVVAINAKQQVNIYCYVNENTYDDLQRRKRINGTIREIVTAHVRRNTVAIDAMIADIKAAIGEDVINVNIDRLGGGRLDRYTLQDKSYGTSVGTEIVQLEDGTYKLRDTIEVYYRVATK